MKTLPRNHLASLAATAFGMFAAIAAAAESKGGGTPPATSPILVEKIQQAPAPSEPAPHPRAISSRFAEALAAARLPYTPSVRASDNPSDLAPPASSGDPDAVIMPRFYVNEVKVPKLNERQVLSQKGEQKMAMSRYLTETYRALNPFTLPLFGRPPEAWATAMLREDDRLRQIETMKDYARLMSLTDKAAATKVKREADKALRRPMQE